MFSKKNNEVKLSEDIDSLIGENLKIIGNIEGIGNLRIDGTVEGNIDYDGDIVIGTSGTIIGNIKGNTISLGGSVNGNIVSGSKLSLLPTSSLKGDVSVASFVVHENARFDGSCKMTGSNSLENTNKIDKK